MKQVKFKTNINCGNCIKSVTPYLNLVDTIDTWQVDTDDPDKILTVKLEEDGTPEDVKRAVEDAGFKIKETVQ
jgi:copper chaperone CopZ